MEILLIGAVALIVLIMLADLVRDLYRRGTGKTGKQKDEQR